MSSARCRLGVGAVGDIADGQHLARVLVRTGHRAHGEDIGVGQAIAGMRPDHHHRLAARAGYGEQAGGEIVRVTAVDDAVGQPVVIDPHDVGDVRFGVAAQDLRFAGLQVQHGQLQIVVLARRGGQVAPVWRQGGAADVGVLEEGGDRQARHLGGMAMDMSSCKGEGENAKAVFHGDDLA